MLVYPPTPGLTNGPPVGAGVEEAVVDDPGVVVFPSNRLESANSEM